MSNNPDRPVWHPEPETLAGALRLAKFYLGPEGNALDAVRRALERLCGKPEALEPHRCKVLFFHRLFHSVSKRGAPARQDAPPGITSLQSLPPASRAVAALFYLTALPPVEIGRVLGIKPGTLASQLAAIRSGFGADASPAGGLSAPVFLRPGTDSIPPPGDLGVFSDAKSLDPSESEQAALDALARNFVEHPHSKMRMKDPAFLAMVLAGVLLLGIGVWIFLSDRPDFEGQERLKSLLLQGALADASDFEPLDEKLSALDDWLALNGIESVFVPPELQNVRSVAVRAFHFDNIRVAAVAVPELNMMVYFLNLPGTESKSGTDPRWQFFQAGPDAAAAIRKGRSVCVAAIRGNIPELQNLLKTTNQPSPSDP